MPPGITMCRVASMTRVADSAASVPGAASAAIVSPATATPQLTTPSGVTTWPPRIIRSNIVSPRREYRGVSAQGLIHAVFVSVHPGNEPAGLQALGKPQKALSRYLRRTRPQSRIPITLKRACQQCTRHVRVIRRNRIGQLLRAVLRNPCQCAASSSHHGVEGGAVAANAVTAGEEGCIDGRPARIRRVKDFACAALQRHGDVWLEHLRDVEFTAAQRLQILRHCPTRYAIDLGGIDAL